MISSSSASATSNHKSHVKSYLTKAVISLALTGIILIVICAVPQWNEVEACRSGHHCLTFELGLFETCAIVSGGNYHKCAVIEEGDIGSDQCIENITSDGVCNTLSVTLRMARALSVIGCLVSIFAAIYVAISIYKIEKRPSMGYPSKVITASLIASITGLLSSIGILLCGVFHMKANVDSLLKYLVIVEGFRGGESRLGLCSFLTIATVVLSIIGTVYSMKARTASKENQKGKTGDIAMNGTVTY